MYCSNSLNKVAGLLLLLFIHWAIIWPRCKRKHYIIVMISLFNYKSLSFYIKNTDSVHGYNIVFTTSYLVIREQDDLIDYLYSEMLCCKTPEHLCDSLAAV